MPALGGVLFLTGALMMSTIAVFTNGSPIAMVSGMTLGAGIALVLTWLTLGGGRGAVLAVRS